MIHLIGWQSALPIRDFFVVCKNIHLHGHSRPLPAGMIEHTPRAPDAAALHVKCRAPLLRLPHGRAYVFRNLLYIGIAHAGVNPLRVI